jgi:uncharacterized protein (DUF433 family)
MLVPGAGKMKGEERFQRRDEAVTMTIHADPVPLRLDEFGVIRIGDTRLSLDVLLDHYLQGLSAEAIADGYQDVVTLADVHAALAYYHRHRDEVELYLQRRRQETEAIYRQIETLQPPRPEFRQTLLDRQRNLDNGHATSGQ